MIDAITAKRKEQQKLLPTVKWGEEPAQNQWRSKYLGSLFEVGGDQMHDVQTRIARALQRFGKMSYMGQQRTTCESTYEAIQIKCVQHSDVWL